MSLTVKDLKRVFNMTYGVRSKWSNVLLNLGVHFSTIESIRQTHYYPDDCYFEGLRAWLTSGERSWKDLEEAVSSPSVGREDIGMVIRDHIKSIGSTNSIALERQTGKLLAS